MSSVGQLAMKVMRKLQAARSTRAASVAHYQAFSYIERSLSPILDFKLLVGELEAPP